MTLPTEMWALREQGAALSCPFFSPDPRESPENPPGAQYIFTEKLNEWNAFWILFYLNIDYFVKQSDYFVNQTTKQ